MPLALSGSQPPFGPETAPSGSHRLHSHQAGDREGGEGRGSPESSLIQEGRLQALVGTAKRTHNRAVLPETFLSTMSPHLYWCRSPWVSASVCSLRPQPWLEALSRFSLAAQVEAPGLSGNDICPPGFFCPRGTGVPVPCPPGSYSSAPGLSSEDQCQPCPPGHYCSRPGLSHALEAGLCDAG